VRTGFRGALAGGVGVEGDRAKLVAMEVGFHDLSQPHIWVGIGDDLFSCGARVLDSEALRTAFSMRTRGI